MGRRVFQRNSASKQRGGHGSRDPRSDRTVFQYKPISFREKASCHTFVALDSSRDPGRIPDARVIRVEKFEFPFLGQTCRAAYVGDETQAMKLIQLIGEAYPVDSTDVMGIDIETYAKKGYKGHRLGGLHPALSEIATVQIYLPNEDETYLFHVSNYAYRLGALVNFIETRRFIAHNAKFEISHFLHHRINPREIGCSMLLFRLLLHAVYDNASSIKSTLEQLIWASHQQQLPKDNQTSDWSSSKLTEEQKVYAVKDAIACHKGGLWCVDRMLEYNVSELLTFYRLNRDAQKAIAQMELNGIGLDINEHNKLIAQWSKEEEEAKTSLDLILPPKLNPRSTTQLSKWFTEELSKTDEGLEELSTWPISEKSGNLTCDAETLDQFSHLPVVEPLQKHRKVSKLLTTYGESLQNCINPETGRIHASFSQCYTDTGRMSSFQPNLQNLPRDKNVRNIFRAAKGHKYVCADLGQIEVRVFAYWSGDEQLIQAFEDGIDPYTLTASKLLRKPIVDVSKAERQMMKAILLGWLFGLGANTLIKYGRTTFKVNIPFNEAKEFLKFLSKSFPQAAAWRKETSSNAGVELFATSRMGKFQKLQPDRYYNKSLNHPIQSDAAACILKAGTLMDGYIREYSCVDEIKVVNVIHDEILAEAREECVDLASGLLYKSMHEGVMHVFPEACERGLIDLHIGDTWAEAKGA